MREFLHVEDMAAACLHVMQLDVATYQANTEPMLSHINVGTGRDVTIRELVETVKKVVDYQGEILWNSEMPDGTPRKLMDVSRLKLLGWAYQVELEPGLDRTYRWFVENVEQIRG
jgi:GDP-L-fucose synthase